MLRAERRRADKGNPLEKKLFGDGSGIAGVPIALQDAIFVESRTISAIKFFIEIKRFNLTRSMRAAAGFLRGNDDDEFASDAAQCNGTRSWNSQAALTFAWLVAPSNANAADGIRCFSCADALLVVNLLERLPVEDHVERRGIREPE
jgi:hypothetical protein